MEQQFWYLKRCGLFERLAAAQIERLEAKSRVRKFAKGELVYLPTDSNSSVCLLTGGRVKIYHLTGDGKQAVLGLIDPGELFGELAVFDEGVREEFAEAMDAATVVLIPREEIVQLMTEHSEVSLGVTKLMGLRRRRIEQRLKSLLFRSNRERLVHLLLELAEKYGRPSVDGVLLNVKLSHQDLASIIGSTRETVTVLLGELQSAGTLTIVRRKIILGDLAELAASIGTRPPQIQQTEDLGNRLLREARARPG